MPANQICFFQETLIWVGVDNFCVKKIVSSGNSATLIL